MWSSAFWSVAVLDGTFLSIAVGGADGTFLSIAVGGVGGTFLSVATEKYPKDRDLRENLGFPLRIPFLFMNTGYVGLRLLSVSALSFGRAGRCAPSVGVSTESLRVRSRPMRVFHTLSGRGRRGNAE